ncbi:MAG: helix-turn-helix transcriptional regulator [Clostridia bacterium]|nr:helix-turn-helix transcriptional regulator [Clostridia bacterium]
MDFGKELNTYMELLDCTTKELAKESGISYSLLNRYINNKRTPKKDTVYLKKLIDGLYSIADKKNIQITRESIANKLENIIATDSTIIDYDTFIENFIVLQDTLNITNVELSKAVGYDSSFISRLKNKERKPANIDNFIGRLVDYIVYQNTVEKNSLATLIHCSKEDLQNNETLSESLRNWLCSKHNKNSDIYNFLSKLDTFSLNDYIGTDFSKIKVPTTPIIFKNSKTFFGVEGRKQAEGEFLKTTLLSKSTEPIFFYSDLPMSNAGNDENFKKKWVLAMSMLLKRGLHLNMIHNLERPINELFLGLENWIPIYMTGSITPYYFKTPPSNFFQISHCTSGSIALSSECLRNNENTSRFYLTSKINEVDFAKEKSKYMLSKATPLMKIYKEYENDKFDEFMKNNSDDDIQIIKKDLFKNIDFYINDSKWIVINKKISPEIHFVIYHEKLIHAIKDFLNQK